MAIYADNARHYNCYYQKLITKQFISSASRLLVEKPVSSFAGFETVTTSKELRMSKWQCTACNYIYDPEKGDSDNGVAPGTKFEDIPDSWVCPECGVPKDQFVKM